MRRDTRTRMETLTGAWTAPGDDALPWLDIAGPPDGHAIVFIHGSGLNRKMWLPQMQALADEFRVLALDLPGHGGLRQLPFRLDASARQLASVIQRETTGQALVVGLSLGGYVATAFAHAYPEATAGLVLASCSVGFRGMLGVLTLASAALYSGAMRLGGGRLNPWLTQRETRALRGSLPDCFAEPQIETGLCMDVWGTTLLQIVTRDFYGMLRRYPHPVLILNGAHDRWNRKTERRHLRAAHTAHLEIIPRAAHLSNLENPADFTRAVQAFASTLHW